MQTSEHKQHILKRVSHNNCDECRADNQRWHAQSQPFKYGHVTEYLAHVRPRLEALRTGQNGGDTTNARIWYRGFVTALHRRISSHARVVGRKYSDGYLERLRMADTKCGRENQLPKEGYLREFARRGACTL